MSMLRSMLKASGPASQPSFTWSARYSTTSCNTICPPPSSSVVPLSPQCTLQESRVLPVISWFSFWLDVDAVPGIGLGDGARKERRGGGMGVGRAREPVHHDAADAGDAGEHGAHGPAPGLLRQGHRRFPAPSSHPTFVKESRHGCSVDGDGKLPSHTIFRQYGLQCGSAWASCSG